jgi:hypothetical protein
MNAHPAAVIPRSASHGSALFGNHETPPDFVLESTGGHLKCAANLLQQFVSCAFFAGKEIDAWQLIFIFEF